MRDPLAPLDCVRLNDPAIDRDHEDTDVAEYAKTRDVKHLRFKEGMKPALFTLHAPPAAYVMASLNRHYEGAPDLKFWFAFLAGCHKVTTANGEVLVPKKFDKGMAYDARIADNKSWTQTIANHFGTGPIVEMGRVIVELANMSPEDEAGFSSPVG
jgi:hypothetical protein